MPQWRLPKLLQRALGAYIPPKEKGVFYLTFDDGPSRATEELLHILHAHGYKATFFWLWSQYRFDTIERLTPLLWAGGHTVALHGMNHVSSWRKSSIQKELSLTIHLWKQVGVPLVPYYRPPFGHVKWQGLPTGWRLVLWDLMPPDYVIAEGWERALPKRLRAGDVVALHERRHNLSAWQRLFSAVAESGWQAVPLPPAGLAQRAG